MVYFVGAGPGAPDLLTLRGARAIAAADIVVWGRSLTMEEVVTDNARADAEILAWPPLTGEELRKVWERAKSEGLVVARLHGGDTAIYGGVREHIRDLRTRSSES